MGEYVKINGVQTNLGTCEDLYYARYSQIKRGHVAWDKVSGNAAPADYLGNGWRYRFPFPDEDDVQVGEFEPFERGVLIHLSNEAAETLARIDGIEHRNVTVHVKPKIKNSHHGFNIFLPCPAVDRYNEYDTSPISDYTKNMVELVRQKIVDGRLVPILRCPWCGSLWRIEAPDGIALLADEIRKQTINHAPKFWIELAKRVEETETIRS